MGKFYDQLSPKLSEFIAQQRIFFVSTAPKEGRLNLSPKGMGGFAVVNENRVAFVNYVGSGNETAAHLLEDPRITVMFCSFEEKPMILKIYGEGRSIHQSDPEWEGMSEILKPKDGARQIIAITVNSVQTSCGEGVPFYEFQGERPTLENWIAKRGEEGIKSYQDKNNRLSIDGKPTGLP